MCGDCGCGVRQAYGERAKDSCEEVNGYGADDVVDGACAQDMAAHHGDESTKGADDECYGHRVDGIGGDGDESAEGAVDEGRVSFCSCGRLDAEL